MLTKSETATLQAIENTIDNLILRCKELYSLYQGCGVNYQSMGVVTRRFLGINAATTDKQVRQVLYAKFLLAAIMEWAPSNYYFSIDGFLNAYGPYVKNDTTNEMCPYWESFFADLHEASTMLEKITQRPTLAFEEGGVEHIAKLVEVAEVKAGWTESLLQVVAGSTSIKGFRVPASEAEIYGVWNQFCLNVGNGMTVTEAASKFTATNNSLPKHVLPDPLTHATQTRIWFPFDMDSQPWVAHAEAILQQPYHLLPLRPCQGMYAHEAQAWILPCTTDFQVNHYDCSLNSPCCLRLHFNCHSSSRCRVWGPNTCVHVRAGAAVCEDAHCKMVDWMKYNVCIPEAYDVSPKKPPTIMDAGLLGFMWGVETAVCGAQVGTKLFD